VTPSPARLAVSRIQLRTSDPEEAAPAFARLYPGAVLRPLPGQPFGCDLGIATVGPVSFVTMAWPFGGRLDAPLLGDRYALGLGAEGSSAAVELEGRRLAIVPGQRAVLALPGRPAKVWVSPGCQGRAVTVERSALEAHFTMLLGHAPRGPIAFEPDLDLTAGAGATLLGIVRLLRDELEQPAPSPLVRPRLCDVLLTSLVTLPHHPGSHLLDLAPPRVAPGCVRRAEEYIAAHAGEAITLADIVAAAGAPARSLQAAFRALRGTTPMAFLKLQRLERVHRQLLAPTPETTVAGVATAMGFSSAGRFSVEHRKRFHESPSETLARGRSGGRR
jgi:AraC-like DNA-binding protein